MQIKLAALASLIVLAAGISGALMFFLGSVQPSQISSTTETGHMLGHVTLVHKDSSGNVLQYIQADNVIINHGDDCALQAIINGTTTTATGKICGTVGAGFKVIGLGNTTLAGGASSAAKADTTLGREIQSGIPSLQRANATSTTYTMSALNSNNGAKVVLVKTFTSTNAGAIVVNEAGLFNSTANGAVPMAAKQAFTNISLANTDTLTITWTITLS